MPEDKIIFRAVGGSKRADNLALQFVNCVTAVDNAVRTYDEFRARCILQKITPPPEKELTYTAQLMAHFAAMLLAGDSLTITAPGPEELAELLKRTLFTEQDAQIIYTVMDEPGSV